MANLDLQEPIPLQGFGERRVAVITGVIDLPSSYTNGGEDLNIAGLFREVLSVSIEPSDGYVFTYDKENDQYMAWQGNYDATGSDGPLVECDGDDLSSTPGTTRFTAHGIVVP